jgi:NADH-quinone oxidoreductase subunit K
MIISLEVMLNAAGFAFVVAGSRWGEPDGEIMFLLVLAMAAAEAAVGMGLLSQIHRRLRTLDVDELSGMRG